MSIRFGEQQEDIEKRLFLDEKKSPEKVGQNQEQPADLEKISQKKTAEIRLAQEIDDKEGGDEFARLSEEFQVEDGLRKKYEERLIKISEKRKNVTDYAISKMKQLIIGASLLGATVQAVEAGASNNDTRKISEDVKVEMTQDNQSESDQYMQEAELIRSKVIERVSSDDYLKKLTTEFGGDVNLAEKEQLHRIANLKSVEIELKGQTRDVMDEYDKLTGGNSFEEDSPKDGFYANNNNLHKIVSYKYNPSTLYHEFLHASTKGDIGVTDSAEKILERTYDKKGFLGMFKNKDDAYKSKPTERLVRLEHFMAELDSLGVQKYGEVFSKDKYERIMELYKKGSLSRNANEFIEKTKPDFESFKALFEKIAKNENTQDVANA